ncbi:MAG: XdhC family protein [Acidimicrobiales bacterium]
MRDIALEATESLAADRAGRVARVVEFKGLGGRRQGDAVLAYADGTSSGSLLGGAAESALRREVGLLGLFELSVGEADAASAGLACGGVASVLFNELGAIPRPAWEALAVGRPVALVTRPDAPSAASAVLALVDSPLTRSYEHHGSVGDAVLDQIASEAARLALRRGRDVAEVQVHEGATLVVEVFLPLTSLVVIGDGQLAEALAAQGSMLGWEVSVDGSWGTEAEALVGSLGQADALVVLSHDPEVDTPALALALSRGCYVGALGSRHTQAGRRERLLAGGADESSVGRIHGPVGLDLGARTPEETAVAIAAEILAHRSGRDAGSLRSANGPING